jgi:hypothetical protein
MHSLQNSNYFERLFLWQFAIWSSGYLIATQRHQPPGFPRLTVALPLAILNFILPLLFDGKDDTMTAVIVFMTTAGLSNFKLLAWVMNRGPLAESWLTRMQCAAVYVFTVIPAKEKTTRTTTTLSSPATTAVKRSGNNHLSDPIPPEKRARLLGVKILGLGIAVPAYALFIDRLPQLFSTILQGTLPAVFFLLRSSIH